MRSRWLLLLAPLLLAIAVVGWAAAGENPGPMHRADAVAGSAGQDEVRAVAAPRDPAPEVLVRTEPPRAQADAATIPADAIWVDVHVVQASGSAAAAADVVWLDATTWQRMQALRDPPAWTWSDAERAARTWGWRTHSDAAGVARVHLAAGTTVFARDGSRYGKLQLDEPPPNDGYRLELVEDRTLLVQVLDGNGAAAAGADIAVDRYGADGALVHSDEPAAATAEDGIARLLHLQEWRERVRANQWRVRLFLRGYSDPGVAFDPDAPPTAPIVLRLPACGSVKARVELGGRPVRSIDSVGLYVGALDDERQQQSARIADPDGWVRFRRVALGASFVAFARLDDGMIQRECAGPAVAGQEVTVVLTVPDDYVVLVGRVVDERREPVRDAELSLGYVIAYVDVGTSTGASLQTDAQGGFQLLLGKPLDAERLEKLKIEMKRANAAPLRAAVAPRPLQPGVQDVGTLVLEAEAIVVAGWFRDGQQPYPREVGFTVERVQERTDPDRGSRITWEPVDDLTTRQGPDGAFEVRGIAGPGRYRLTFGGIVHLPVAPVEFAPGATGLVVQIAPGLPLTATVLLPPDLPWGLLARLRPDTAAELPDGDARARLDDRYASEPSDLQADRAQLRWCSLPPGSYTLEFSLWAERQPLLAIHGIELTPSAAPDPRLLDIDLRDRLTTLALRLVDPDGTANARSGLVFPMPQDPAVDWLAYEVRAGRLRMPVRPGPIDLVVAVWGFRPREVRGARGEVTVAPDRWPEVELLIDAALQLPAGLTLSVSLQGSEPEARGRFLTRGSSGYRDEYFRPPQSGTEGREGRVSLPIGDGPHRLVVVLRRGDTEPESADQRRADHERAITGVTPATVVAGPAVSVQLPAAELRRAIAALQQDRPK